MNNKFDQFIKDQTQSMKEDDGGLSIQDEKKMWIEKLDELYELIEKSLSEYTHTKDVKIEYQDINLFEELLGAYSVKAANITIGKQVVKLVPLGTFLIGARGRVNVVGPKGDARLLIVPPNATTLAVRVSVVTPGQKAPEELPSAPPNTWVWKIATPPPRVTYIDLNEESFREVLMGVVNG